MIDYRVRNHGWRLIHRGVYDVNAAPLTPRQLWIAATLTAPGSYLSHWSAGACLGIRPFKGAFQSVTRAGRGGRRQIGRLVLFRATALGGEVTTHDGIPITTAARTVIDLAPDLHPLATAKAFRESLRLKLTTMRGFVAALDRHRGRRGTGLLWELASRYAGIPYDRTCSDAEARALEVLHDAGIEPPRVNERFAGEEADLTWPGREIIEVDGPQFHEVRAEDARKEACWRRAAVRTSRWL